MCIWIIWKSNLKAVNFSKNFYKEIIQNMFGKFFEKAHVKQVYKSKNTPKAGLNKTHTNIKL